MKRIWQFFGVQMGLILLWIVLVSSALFFFTLQNDPSLATATVAFGTLVLAIVMTVSIVEANGRERHRMEEDSRVRQEERELDFRRRCLNDIQNWAYEGISCLKEIKMLGLDRERSLRILAPLQARNKWVMDASREFAQEDEKRLLKKVDEAAENIKQCVEVFEGKLSGGDYMQRHEQCLTSMTGVLEGVANLKVIVR